MDSVYYTYALGAAAVAAVVALIVQLRQTPAAQAVAGDVSGLDIILKDIDARLRDGRIDQETADAERRRVLEGVLSLHAAGASSARRLARSPAALAALAMALTAAFAFAAAQEEGAPGLAAGQPAPAPLSRAATAAESGLAAPSADPALSRLQAYAKALGEEERPASSAGRARTAEALTGSAAPLPDVDTMISRLAARLEKDPNNAEGWRMLGWSYFNTGAYDKAVEAYARAIALKPDSAAFKAAHAEAVAKAALKKAPEGAAAPDAAAPAAAAPEPAPEAPATPPAEPAKAP